ncbi:hypothetical protein QYS42_22725 [Klebsiella pneumoniae]|nr:hypothetical protein [Klebsiella pneumoniae]MCS5797547.1 hypothetical protein [Klebsiella pneumoniae subsp. pneumoniae]MDS6687931.1 hypothetical protein [Klebsiella pneumoniae]WGQ31619.1 hypothetical protein PZA16_22970 [Klebsiella pneumoniae]
MALHQISHHFSGTHERASLQQTVHCGVVGSGDLEILLEPKALAGGIEVSICTPVTGFDHIWEIVLKRFLDSGPWATCRSASMTTTPRLRSSR